MGISSESVRIKALWFIVHEFLFHTFTLKLHSKHVSVICQSSLLHHQGFMLRSDWSSSFDVTSQRHTWWCIRVLLLSLQTASVHLTVIRKTNALCPTKRHRSAHLSLSLSVSSGGGTGCPRCFSTWVLAADWLRAQGCRRSEGRKFDMTGRLTNTQPTRTHTVLAGASHSCRDTEFTIQTLLTHEICNSIKQWDTSHVSAAEEQLTDN